MKKRYIHPLVGVFHIEAAELLAASKLDSKRIIMSEDGTYTSNEGITNSLGFSNDDDEGGSCAKQNPFDDSWDDLW